MAANPYDPITTSDSTQLADDEWGLSLPPIRYKRHSGTSRFKSLCSDLRRQHRAVVFITVAVCMIILIAIIIIVAASSNTDRHPTGAEERWSNPEQGLVFYPIPKDKSIVISFNPLDFHNIARQPIAESLDSVFTNYKTEQHFSEEDVYTECTYENSPGNMTCIISNEDFGQECTPYKNYGYQGSQPCVFIQLNLPDGVVIKKLSKESQLWKDAPESVKAPELDPSYIPLTCQGTEPADTKILESVKGLGINNERIMYYPPKGLLSYIYRERDTNLPFLKPAMMVQFTKVVSRKLMHITCTAWGQLYDFQDKPITHQLLTVQFAFYSHPI